MNSSAKIITGVVLIGLGFLVWPPSTPPEPTEDQAKKRVKADTKKSNRRRARTGPRKPPLLAPTPVDATEARVDEPPPSEENTPEKASDKAQNAPEDVGRMTKEQKLEEYLEHLEAIDDPNVDEMTMLGEMAFDANEAEDAYDHYLDVIENHTDDPKAPFALYKLAWTEYNLGDVDAAIDDMELVIEWVGDSDLPLHEMLRTEGAKDLESFHSQAD